MARSKFTVDFEPLGKRVEVPQGSTLLEAARLAGLALTADCGGAGSCGQCRVIARESGRTLSQPNLTELAQLTDEERAGGVRLACQAEVLGDVKIDVPAASVITQQRLQVDAGIIGAVNHGVDERVITAHLVQVPEPTLHDPRGDLERLLSAMGGSSFSVSPSSVRALPALLRKHLGQVQVIIRGGEIMAFLPPDARPLGLAVDLGTTKIAAYLVDIATGAVLVSEGRPNPQIGYGEDVISRLGYAMKSPEDAETLSRVVCSAVAELAEELTRQAGRSTQEIVEACIVGNTAMLHILLEFPVRQLALAPYVPATALPQELRAAELNLPFAADARVYIPASVAGYVGADLVAMTLASGIGDDDRTVLGIDIGTNTEIVLSIGRGSADSPRMYSLSCASGPAFEGAHIKAGMRAAAGAIERVWLGSEKARVQTIGGVPPVGICGSGIIDAIAEMRRAEVINARGRLQMGLPGVFEDTHGLAFQLVSADETGTGEPITIIQNDVDEIQFAKGAIKAGISVLLEAAQLSLEDLDEVVLAGAFGSYLNLDTATAIDLLPDIPLEKYRQVGNAAGVGAQQMLISVAARAKAAAMARKIAYIELSTYPNFRKIYAKSMALSLKQQ